MSKRNVTAVHHKKKAFPTNMLLKQQFSACLKISLKMLTPSGKRDGVVRIQQHLERFLPLREKRWSVSGGGASLFSRG